MKTKTKKKHYRNEEFFTKSKKRYTEILTFWVITFEPIKFLIFSEPQFW